jgi:hypothetical protein
MLLNAHWQFGNILLLSSNNRISSFYWIRGSKHCFLTSFSNLTTVSKSIDFLPLAGNYSLEMGNYPLLFLYQKLRREAVEGCDLSLEHSGR